VSTIDNGTPVFFLPKQKIAASDIDNDFNLALQKMATSGIPRVPIRPNVKFDDENAPTIENGAVHFSPSAQIFLSMTSTTIMG
jgi:hypothetical protein